MTEIILGIISLSLIGYIVWSEREHSKKESKYIKAILAKDLPEMVEAEAVENREEVEEKPPEFIAVEDADEDTFDKMIKEQGKIDN